MTLQQFLESDLRNSWISEGYIDVYVRKSRRIIDGQLTPCFDVASVTVQEDQQGKGLFTQFMQRIILEIDTMIYVESILNPAVERVCESLGFTIVKNFEDVNAYIKPKYIK
jgi:GNAT superfamily N-acetyltransferase